MVSDPAYLRAFKEYAKSSPSVDDRDAMEKEFYGQSDRACGVLNASWLEQSIELSIQRILRPDYSRKLFDFEGPLGTFSAKIMMAYAMGLFGSKTNHDLLLIRTIRNEFAHCQLPLRFDIPEVKAVCDHLIIPDIENVRVIPMYIYQLPTLEPLENLYDKDHPKERFITCCHSIIYQLFYMGRTAMRLPMDSKLP